MKISGNDEIAKYISETNIPQTKDTTGKSSSPADVSPETKGDTVVNLSERSKEVQRAENAIESAPDMRPEKVQAIKDRIENGTYKVDYEKTAEKMVKAFFDDIA